MTHYQKAITEHLKGRQYDPRHIEAYMRLGHATLNGLSASQFRQEVEIGIQCIDADGTDNAERNAQSFGL